MTLWIAFKLFLAVYILWNLIVAILVIHEFGHLIAMKKLGIVPDKVVIGSRRIFNLRMARVNFEIGLVPLWGYVGSKSYEHAPPDKRAIVAAAGPLMSIVTGLAFLGINHIHPFWIISLLAKGSFILVVTNLIPLPPLDGWTIVEYFILKAGFKITPIARKVLLGAGFVAIIVMTFLV